MSAPLPRPPPRRLGRRLLAGLVGTALALGLAEALVRGFTDTVPPLTEVAADVGVVNTPGFVGTVVDRESKRAIELRFNAEGFRGPEWTTDHPGDLRVAVLGDSMVAGLAVAEEELLTSRMAEAGGPGWEVMNWGVPGASLGSQLALWRARVARYHPDVVVAVFFSGNDLSDNCACLDTFPRVYFELDAAGALVERPRAAARSAASRWLNRHSRFYVWQKDVVNRAGKQVSHGAGRPDPGALVYLREAPPEAQEPWAITGAVARALDAEVRAAGARLLLVELPEAAALQPERLAALAKARGLPAEAMDAAEPARHLAERATGVELHTLLPVLAAESPGSPPEERAKRLYFYGHGHLTPEGHAVVGRALAGWVAEATAPP